MAEWVMVIITFVYVVATIFICIANFRSAKATRAQVEESKHQFKENQRMQVMPSMQIDVGLDVKGPRYREEFFCKLYSDDQQERCRFAYFFISLENAGLGTAKNFAIWWCNVNKTNASERLSEFEYVLYQRDAIKFLINVGLESRRANVGDRIEAKMLITYKDLLDNEYTQTIHLFFEITAEMYAIYKDSIIGKAEII